MNDLFNKMLKKIDPLFDKLLFSSMVFFLLYILISGIFLPPTIERLEGFSGDIFAQVNQNKPLSAAISICTIAAILYIFKEDTKQLLFFSGIFYGLAITAIFQQGLTLGIFMGLFGLNLKLSHRPTQTDKE